MRKWIFPSLRIVIFLVISVALAKMAFFTHSLNATTAARPTAHLEEPLATVDLGTITNNVVIKSTIFADGAVVVKAPVAGDVKKILAKVGQAVEAATPIISIHSSIVSDDGAVVNKTVTVVAGSVGILSALSVQTGQIVAVGDSVGQVAPQSFSVSGTLPAEQQYRLMNKPSEGQVTVKGGPAPFTCTGVTISSAGVAAPSPANSSDAPSLNGNDSSSHGDASSTTIRCAVPAGVTVFSGLTATLTVAGGVATDVLIVPNTAVEGSNVAGTVYLHKDDGTSVATPVTLGLTDGVNVQITAGVNKGDRIRQFVPGAEAKPEEVGGMVMMGMGH